MPPIALELPPSGDVGDARPGPPSNPMRVIWRAAAEDYGAASKGPEDRKAEPP